MRRKHIKSKGLPIMLTISVLAVALAAIVWMSDGGKNLLLRPNTDIGANTSSGRQLDAKSPVAFPAEPIVMTLDTEKESSFDSPGNINGTMEYIIKNVQIFDNLRDAGIEYSELFERFRSGDLSNKNYSIYSHNKKKTIDMYSYCVLNGKTGRLIDDCYLLLFEVEMTNVNAVYDVRDSAFDYSNTDFFKGSELFTLWRYDESRGYRCSQLVYVKENAKAETGVWGSVKLPKGQPTRLHIGFIVLDNSDDGFSEMGLKLCDKSISDCDEQDYIYWFNLSKMIEDYKNCKGENS